MFFKSKPPIPLTVPLRKAAERNSILSACSGAMGDITLTDSAIIILYAAMLGASDMFSMVTTSVMPLVNGICIIPMAWVATKTGNQSLILRVCVFSFMIYLLIASVPFFGDFAVPLLIGSLIMFSVSHTGYTAGWFPMLDSFLAPESRNRYLSRMRFSWQLSAASFLFVVGFIIGKNPPIEYIQIVILVSALIYSGRMLFISRIPVFETKRTEKFGFKSGLATALANKPLVGYSVYLFILNLAAYGTLPLAILYMKRHLQAPDNIIVIISSLTLGGMLLGSLLAGRIINRWGIRAVLLSIHIVYALINASLFFVGKDAMSPTLTYVVISALLFVYSFVFANANIASTSEMMALATPGNKAMAMAFCGTFYYGGSGLSRLLTSVVLGLGILTPEWHIGSLTFCHYQTIFLIYAVSITFAAMFLVIVPAIFPKGEYHYGMGDR